MKLKPGVVIVSSIMVIAATAGIWYFTKSEEPAGTSLPTQQNVNQPPATNTQAPTPGTAYKGDVTAAVATTEIVVTGSGTQGLDVDPETGFVYLGNNGSVISMCDRSGISEEGRDTMSIVDPSQSKEIARVGTGGGPIWPTVDPERDVVYMASSGTHTIDVHRRGTGEKLQSIQTGGLPHMGGMLDGLMVVSNTFNQSQTYYSVIDLNTRMVTASYESPSLPHPVVVDPAEKIAYMMGVQDGSVAVIDMTTGKKQETFTLSGGGGQLWLSKKFNKLYTGAATPGTAAAAFDLTTHKPAGTVSFTDLNQPGTSITVDETGGLLFIVVADKNALGIADADTLKPLGYFTVGECPYAVRLDLDRGRGYVSNSASHSLTVFDLAKVRAAVGK